MEHMEGQVASRRTYWPWVYSGALLLPLTVWMYSVADIRDYFYYQVPPGQRLYIFSKLVGLLAITLLWLQCVVALAKYLPATRKTIGLPTQSHAILGIATFVAVLVHATLFIAAATVRTGHLAIGQLMPQFDQGYFAACVSLGAIGFWTLIVVLCAGWLRRRQRQWRWLHRFGFLAFGLGFAHSIGVGSESRLGPMVFIYLFFAAALAVVAMHWIAASLRKQHAIRLPTGRHAEP
jgi:predicted ferric reductase